MVVLFSVELVGMFVNFHYIFANALYGIEFIGIAALVILGICETPNKKDRK